MKKFAGIEVNFAAEAASVAIDLAENHDFTQEDFYEVHYEVEDVVLQIDTPCMLPGIPVTMMNGATKHVDQIAPGDKVLVIDASGSSAGEVLQVFGAASDVVGAVHRLTTDVQESSGTSPEFLKDLEILLADYHRLRKLQEAAS